MKVGSTQHYCSTMRKSQVCGNMRFLVRGKVKMKMFIVRNFLVWFGLLEKGKCIWYAGGKRRIENYYVWKVNPYHMFKVKK